MLWNETYQELVVCGDVLLATVVTKPSLQPNIGTLVKCASMDLVFDISVEGFQTILSFYCANRIERLSVFKSWKDCIYKLNAHKYAHEVIITHTFSPRWVCLFIWTNLEKFCITSLAHQWILCSEWVPSEWESKQLIKPSQKSTTNDYNLTSCKVKRIHVCLTHHFFSPEFPSWGHVSEKIL